MAINTEVGTIMYLTLVDLEPNLDLHGMDKTVLNMCMKDFQAYKEYLKDTVPKVMKRNELTSDIVPQIYVFDTFDLMDSDDDLKFVKEWTQWWFKQYKKRVKLTFTMNITPVNNQKAMSFLNKISDSEVKEIKDHMRNTLIKHGEICGVTVLVETTFNKTLAMYSPKADWNVEAKVRLMNEMTKTIKKLPYVSGPLIFLKPTKASYGVREFRSDGALPTSKQ